MSRFLLGAAAQSFFAGRRKLVGKLLVTTVLSAGLLASGALAQSFSFSNISVSGNQRIEAGTVANIAGISPGQTLSAAELNDAAQRIRASGLFETVDIVPQGGTLLIQVTEYPTINRINFEGNQRLSGDALSAVVQSAALSPYSPTRAEQDVAAIVRAYVDQGRISASVTPRIIRRADNRVDLVFEIVEGGVTEIERISFVGNRSYGDSRLRRVLATKQAGPLRTIIQRDTFVQDRLGFDRQLLTDFYRSRGYVDFAIQNVDVGLTRERDAYLVTFNITEGQQFRFGNVSVSSSIPEANGADFSNAIVTRSGAVYSPALIDNDIARLERRALELGLNFVQVEPRITRNERDLTLDLDYVLVRGERVFVERIDISGNSTTLDRVVRNQFRVVEGDPFNPREIQQSAARIRALGFFSDAQVNARPGSSEDQVVIDVDVVEQPTGSLSFGANFSTDTGVGLVASFAERNFLGRGQSLNFSISTGESNRRFSFDFAEPQFLGRDLRFGVSTAYVTTQRENANYNTESFRFSPSLAFPVSDNGRLSVFYAFNYTDLSNPSADLSGFIQDEVNLGDLSTNAVGYSYTFDNRRTGLNPNAGIVLRFGQEFGIGEDTQYIQTSALAAAETTVFNEEVTLRATVEGGYLSYSEGSSRVTDRYFLGSRLMRGFEPGGIGPRDADTDDALGGNSFAVVRLESEFPLGLPEEYGITGGAFIDYGSVWDVGRDDPGTDVLYDDFIGRSVVGVSVFWTTPIGPLRFNFTEPLDVQDRDKTRNFDLTISTTF